jgi:hypothetical protein
MAKKHSNISELAVRRKAQVSRHREQEIHYIFYIQTPYAIQS